MGPHHCQVTSALPSPHTPHLSCHPPLALHLLLHPQLQAVVGGSEAPRVWDLSRQPAWQRQPAAGVHAPLGVVRRPAEAKVGGPKTLTPARPWPFLGLCS